MLNSRTLQGHKPDKCRGNEHPAVKPFHCMDLAVARNDGSGMNRAVGVRLQETKTRRSGLAAAGAGHVTISKIFRALSLASTRLKWTISILAFLQSSGWTNR